MDLSLIYDELMRPRRPTDVSTTVKALGDAIEGFWRAYDAEPPRGPRTAYDCRMDGFRETAREDREIFLGDVGVREASNSFGRNRFLEKRRRAEDYRQKLISLIKTMVQYRKKHMTEALMYHKFMIQDVHEEIYKCSVAQVNPFTLSPGAALHTFIQ